MNAHQRATQFDPQATEPKATVRVCGLQHYFGEGELRRQVLFDNNLVIRRGEIVIMTGPSGSGKTTLLTLIGTLRSVYKDAGELWLLDEPLHHANPATLTQLRKRIGFIFQAHNLFGSLNATENVRMALELTGEGGSRRKQNERCQAMLDAVGLGQRLYHKPKQLSGGQKQRVAIARALVHNPELILADEPTAALDEHAGRTVVELLRRRADEEGVTILMVTHDNRILDVADRIVNMVDGHIRSDVRVGEAQRISEALKACEIFKDVTPRTLVEVSEQMEVVHFPAGHRIITQGDVGDAFYMIRDGQVAVRRDPGNTLIAEIGPGGYFGETALLTDKPRNAHIDATTDVVLFRLDKVAFDAAMDARASLDHEVRDTLFAR